MSPNPLSDEPGPEGRSCAGCVWHYRGGRGRPVERCRRHGHQRVSGQAASCGRFTPELDCLRCAACCREAYHAVEVGPRDPFVAQHPALVVREEGRLRLRRVARVCAALAPQAGTWPCTVYSERPKTCRGFEVASDNCLIARDRLGIR